MNERYNHTELLGTLAHSLQEAVKDCTLDSVVGDVEEHREQLKNRTLAHFNSGPHEDKGIQTRAEPDALDDDVIRVYVKPPRVADRINVLFEIQGPEMVPKIEHTLKGTEEVTLTRESLEEFHRTGGFRDGSPVRRPDVAIMGHVDPHPGVFPLGSSVVEPCVAREHLRLRRYTGIVLDQVAGVWVMAEEGHPKPQEVVDIWVAGGRIPNVTHIADGMYQMGCGPTHADAWLRLIRPDGSPLR